MNEISLSELAPNEPAIITAIESESDQLTQDLLAIGIIEGEKIMILHQAPYFKDPLAIQIRGATLAIRKADASHIKVKKVTL